jgi:hypothetical protein
MAGMAGSPVTSSMAMKNIKATGWHRRDFAARPTPQG